MTIGDARIGPNEPVFVIAEIGVNHDGSVHRALELVDAASAAGADAIKLQVFKADALMHASAQFAGYQKASVDAPDPASMLRRYELSNDDLTKVASAARAASLKVIATPFSPDDVAAVSAIADAIKIASPDLVNRVLLREAAAHRLPLLISTGASTSAEIEDAVRWLRALTVNFALMHCVSSYPTPPETAQLGWLNGLAAFEVPVGYSDHTSEPLAGALAVAAGACFVEKHLTYNTTAIGPDHSASFDPKQLKFYVEHVRLAEKMRGKGMRTVLPCEDDVRNVSRQSLVARRAIAAGERFEFSHITTQRPGNGISAVHIDRLVGKYSARDIKAGQMLTADAIAGWTDET